MTIFATVQNLSGYATDETARKNQNVGLTWLKKKNEC